MPLTEAQLQDLKLIKKCPKALRKQLLEKLPLRSVKAICECSLNVLKGNIPLTSQQKKSLSHYKSTIRKVGSKKGALFQKKRLIIQNGGFLNILIPAALSVLTGLIHGTR